MEAVQLQFIIKEYMFVLKTYHMFYVLRKLIITVPAILCNLLIYGKTLLYHSNFNKNSKMTKKSEQHFLYLIHQN